MSCESLPMNAPSSIVVVLLVHAVVVARDRAGADVDVVADRRIAEIGEVHRLRAGAEHGLLHLDEVADLARRSPTSASLRRCANGPTCDIVGRRRDIGDHAVVETVTRSPICELTIRDAAVDLAAGADRRAALRATRRDG